MENKNTMVTTLRGVSEELHWEIKAEALRRSREGTTTTVNDIYLELIEKGKDNSSWIK